jgi:hypothetical protein
MPASKKGSRPTEKANKYAATSWAKDYTCDLKVPSGQLCLVRRPGPAGLIAAGVLDSLDVLTGLVQTEHVDRVEPSPEGERRKEELAQVSNADLLEIAKNPERLAKAMELVDKVICYVVLQPPLLPVPEADPETGEVPSRVPDSAYIDMVDIEDKFYIFNFVLGGTEDLVAFREKFSASVGSLEALAGVPKPTE